MSPVPSTPPPLAGPKPRVIAISNQKGGEGKTTTAVNLAASLAAAEYRVLLIDLDPQANASSAVGYPRGSVETGTYEVLMGSSTVADAIHETELETLRCIPSTPDLAGAEVELVAIEQRETVLSRAIAPLRKGNKSQFDYVFLDCPPSLGLITINALAAADTVLIPMQAKYFSLEGLSALTGTIEAVKQGFNAKIAVEGIVFCLFDPRTNLAQQVVKEVRGHFEDLVYETVIPINIRLSESPSHGKPVLLYDIESKGSKAYLELANEMLARHRPPAPAKSRKAKGKKAAAS